MTIFLIYKQILNNFGEIEKIELIECDANETMANRFAKLYTLQTPMDLKNKINYQYIGVRVT